MPTFQLHDELRFDVGPVEQPSRYAEERGAASWLFLCGDEFAALPGGLSWAEVCAAVPQAARVVSDPPRVLDLDLAREHVKALEAGADPHEVVRAGIAAGAPFAEFEEYRRWVVESMAALGDASSPGR